MKILIPAFEPSEKINNLIDELQKITDTPIIVIDDGSGKNYKEIFNSVAKKGVKVLTHKNNKGKGEAIKTGIKYLLQIGENQGVVTADCDGQHSPKDIVKVMKKLEESNKDLILGVRSFNKKDIPLRSKFGNKLTVTLFKLKTGKKIRDTQTGLRGYSSRIFEWMTNVEGSKYDYEFNILLEIKEKLSYEEVEIETVYENNNEVSHFRPIQDSILIYKKLWSKDKKKN